MWMTWNRTDRFWFGRNGESTDEHGNNILVLRSAFTDFGKLQKALEDKGITPLISEIEWIPSNTVPVTEEGKKM